MSLVLCIWIAAAPAFAQRPEAPEGLRASMEKIAREQNAALTRDRSDSLKNGLVIGAVVGGLALGGFALLLCRALHEPGNPPCWKGTLAIGGLGAGIGAAAGAGIDALLARRISARPGQGGASAALPMSSVE